MAKFNSARWLRRYGKCQSLNEIIKAARTDSARKPNEKKTNRIHRFNQNTAVPSR